MLFTAFLQITNGLQNAPVYANSQKLELDFVSSAPGSVKATMTIYQYEVNHDQYDQHRDTLLQTLLDLARNSEGYLDPDSISIGSTGDNKQ